MGGARLIVPAVEVAKLAQAAGWDGWRIVTAIQVTKAESGHDAYLCSVVGAPERAKADGSGMEPNPAYRSIDVGLFQVNSFWHPKLVLADALDPVKNAAYAYRLWRYRFDNATGSFQERVAAAWQPWHVYTSGAHRKYEYEAVLACRQAGINV